MFHIFHGEKLVESLREIDLLKEKLKVGEVIDLDGKKLTPTELIQATESESLFQNTRLVIVRNYLARFKRGDTKELKAQIERIPNDAETVFVESNEISKTILNLFPKNTDIALFNPDRLIFKLVDSIGVKPTKDVYYLFTECLKLEPPEFIFTMLVRQFRLLLQIKAGEIPKGLMSWQVGKLKSQASSFTRDELLKLYRKLLDTDFSSKSGTSVFPLEKTIAQLVLSKI